MNTYPDPDTDAAHAAVIRVHRAFTGTFRGAVPRHRFMLFQEWGRLAAVPARQIEDFITSGYIRSSRTRAGS